MKKAKPSLFKIVSAVAEPAVTNINHKLWEIIEKQKKRTAMRDAYVNEPVNKHQTTPRTAPIPKETKKTVDVLRANPMTEPATDFAVPELIPLESAIQSFLTSSKLDGYIDPFLELEIVRNCPDPEKIAGMINQALCIIRYLCKGDRIFCVCALFNMLEVIKKYTNEGRLDQYTVATALSVGASAVTSQAFGKYFDDNIDEGKRHVYIMAIPCGIELADFIGWVKAAFETQHYSCPDFLHHSDFMRLIQKNEDSAPKWDVSVWTDAINEIIKPNNLSFEYIESGGDNYLIVLLNRMEANVFKGMMNSIRHNITP